ncbi:MAG: DNA modification methylase [Colwellia sp.]|nr:DNA modification methylase [Colwellia sp.]
MNPIKIKLSNYKKHPKNPNTHPPEQITELRESLREFDQPKNIVVWKGFYIAGHGLVEAAELEGIETLYAEDVSHWSEEKAMKFMVADNGLAAMGVMDDSLLTQLLGEFENPTEIPGVTDDLLAQLMEGIPDSDNDKEEPPEPQIDKAEELAIEYGVELGQIWQLGEHRVACGDCTDGVLVKGLMDGERTVLTTADPPYGMGKEKDGVVNDNLYREGLDNFQMQWWGTCRPYLGNNASAYIWGNPLDLWRLWHDKLKHTERLTFRNEIVWLKENAIGENSPKQRMFAVATERCLFFFIGEQGHNNNADNYWEGFEGIRSYLYGEVEKLKKQTGMSLGQIGAELGVSGRMVGHWITKSQWEFITEKHYLKLQQLSNDTFNKDYDTFKKDYNDVKKDYNDVKEEFYATRAYFDNVHDSMRDVWRFNRLQNEDRYGHATPKPVEVMERIIKSSSPEGAVVYSPFLGSGTDLIACEKLNRKCRAIEISPAYVATSIKRWEDFTGEKAVLVKPR